MQGAVPELAQRRRGEPFVAGELVTVRDGDEPALGDAAGGPRMNLAARLQRDTVP
jgi:hypothetical protein